MTASVRLANLFWTTPERNNNPPDPLGLDAMREELSNRLVPCLTGRTISVKDAFWTLILLRWSTIPFKNDPDAVRNFLSWERCLKLTWAKFPKMHDGKSFDGIELSRKQSDEEDAPQKKPYRPVLHNQRSQGLLGVHLQPFRSLDIVERERIMLTDSALVWTEGTNKPPRLSNGDWSQWRVSFEQVCSANLASFRRKFHERLKLKMPELYCAMERLNWSEKEAWNDAAPLLGSNGPTSSFAHEFCRWSHEVRKVFNSVVFDGKSSIDSWPVLKMLPTKDLMGTRWDSVRAFASRPPTLRELCDWHEREFRARRRGESDLWLSFSDGKLYTHQYNGSRSESTLGDCRWSNAVMMMKRNDLL
jgi:hypothetical protein